MNALVTNNLFFYRVMSLYLTVCQFDNSVEIEVCYRRPLAINCSVFSICPFTIPQKKWVDIFAKLYAIALPFYYRRKKIRNCLLRMFNHLWPSKQKHTLVHFMQSF